MTSLRAFLGIIVAVVVTYALGAFHEYLNIGYDLKAWMFEYYYSLPIYAAVAGLIGALIAVAFTLSAARGASRSRPASPQRNDPPKPPEDNKL
jgi:H+/Cl- antiporter ClcA